MLVIAGLVAFVVMQSRTLPPATRVYGPEPYASARVAANKVNGEESEERKEPPTDRVQNPRKADPEETPAPGDVRVPATHIVGFRWRQSSDSRSRLLARQHDEMKRHLLHQYE